MALSAKAFKFKQKASEPPRNLSQRALRFRSEGREDQCSIKSSIKCSTNLNYHPTGLSAWGSRKVLISDWTDLCRVTGSSRTSVMPFGVNPIERPAQNLSFFHLVIFSSCQFVGTLNMLLTLKCRTNVPIYFDFFSKRKGENLQKR